MINQNIFDNYYLTVGISDDLEHPRDNFYMTHVNIHGATYLYLDHEFTVTLGIIGLECTKCNKIVKEYY